MTKPSWLALPSAEQANGILLDRYTEVLDPEQLAHIGETEQRGILSGLFLPGVADAYVRSPFRIMLIGQETRSWRGRLSDLRQLGSAGDRMREHVRASMQGTLAHSLKPPRRSKFMQFYDELHDAMGEHVESPRNSIFWGNLLCVSLNGGTPVKAGHIEQLQALSRKLLHIQLDVLRPHVVVFASGWRYDPFVRAAISSYGTHTETMIPKRFWPFRKLGDPEFEGYRVPHPRAHDKTIRCLVLHSVREQANRLAAQQPA